jgi:hypothetical protein
MHWASWRAGTSCEWDCVLASRALVLTSESSFYEALLIPFEITALNLVISFWSEEITKPGPCAGICIGVIICYG